MTGRPAAIVAFATLFLAQALITFGMGLSNLEGGIAYHAARYPTFDWDRDSVIVVTSARLSIALIPVALVWFFANRFARWMCTFLAIAKVVTGLAATWQEGEAISASWVVASVLSIIAVVCLFTPAAARWFREGRTRNARCVD